jgi:MFS superfamily sulfate permease-like transporter
MGAISLSAGISQGLPSALGRTAVNDQMGARTQISGCSSSRHRIGSAVSHKPIQYLPQAALGAVIVAAAIE